MKKSFLGDLEPPNPHCEHPSSGKVKLNMLSRHKGGLQLLNFAFISFQLKTNKNPELFLKAIVQMNLLQQMNPNQTSVLKWED